MKDNNMYSRRKFIAKYLYTSTFLIGGAVILGCDSMKSLAKDKPKVPSDGPSPVPEEASQPPQDTTKSAAAQNQKSKVAAQQKNPCDDLTGVSPAEIEKRKAFAYTNKTPIPDSSCSNCALYMPPAEGKACGGCLLFKGPVRAEGYCTYWAAVSK